MNYKFVIYGQNNFYIDLMQKDTKYMTQLHKQKLDSNTQPTEDFIKFRN